MLVVLKGEKGSAGATLTVTTDLLDAMEDVGDLTIEVEFLAESLGKDLRSKRTLGKEPNP